jgi:hypothetical protein
MSRWFLVLGYYACFACVGCASKLDSDDDAAPSSAEVGAEVTSGNFSSQRISQDVTQTTVDASSDSEWQHWDFDTATATDQAGALHWLRWMTLFLTASHTSPT